MVDVADGPAFRAVYTVRSAEAVYVLHAFRRKSKRGIATPKAELDLIERRSEAHERGLRTMVRKRKERIKVTPSSGNVFADLGLQEPKGRNWPRPSLPTISSERSDGGA
jgi:hypothetical protein